MQKDSSEMRVRVQWSRGAILPVLAKKTMTGSELSKLLRFACSHNDEILLVHNGIPLNGNLSLENQFVKENDILEAFVVRKSNKNVELDSKIHSIVFEAARVADRHNDALENNNDGKTGERAETKKKVNSSDDDYFDLFIEDTNEMPENPEKMVTDPLPVFWNKHKRTDKNMLNKKMPTKISNIEEAGKFLEKQGWSSWMW